MPSSGTPVQLTRLSWPDSTPKEGGKRREMVKELSEQNEISERCDTGREGGNESVKVQNRNG